jgi:hypothetical protein
MFGPLVKIRQREAPRIQQCVAKAGCSSPDEFLRDVLAREVHRLEAAEIRNEIRRQLRGLGYLE